MHTYTRIQKLLPITFNNGDSKILSFKWYRNIMFRSIKKWSRYRPGLGQRVGEGIALLFHDRDTRRGWVVSCTPRPHFTPGKDPVPILQEAGGAPGPVWTGGKSPPHWDSIPDRPARIVSRYTDWATYVPIKRYSYSINRHGLLNGCESWSITLREESRLWVFENRVLRRIFGPKRGQVAGE